MDLSTLLRPAQCLVDQRFASKAQCLEALSQKAAGALGIDAAAIAEPLRHREALGSTGLGHGIALPHARLTIISQPFCLLSRLREPLAFEAVDEKPVNIVCPRSAANRALLRAIARPELRGEAAARPGRPGRDAPSPRTANALRRGRRAVPASVGPGH